MSAEHRGGAGIDEETPELLLNRRRTRVALDAPMQHHDDYFVDRSCAPDRGEELLGLAVDGVLAC